MDLFNLFSNFVPPAFTLFLHFFKRNNAVFSESRYLDEQPDRTGMCVQLESWIMEDIWNYSLLSTIRVFTIGWMISRRVVKEWK